jgi:hypothetical protein
VWVTFMSAHQIHIEIEPQFDFCVSTAILADITFRGFVTVKEYCWRFRASGMLRTLGLLDAEDESTVVILFKCHYLFASQDCITLQKTFEPWDSSFFTVVIISIC